MEPVAARRISWVDYGLIFLVCLGIYLEVAIYLSQTLRFKRPVRIGDAVTAQVTVTDINEAKAQVTLSTVCTVNGKAVVEGEALVMVPRKAA